MCAGMCVLGVLYVPISRSLAGGTVSESFGNLDPWFQLKFQLHAFNVLAHSAFGIIIALRSYTPTLIIPALWALFIGYTIYRVPRTGRAWLAFIVIAALNFAMLAISVRTRIFGLTVAMEPRYFYEMGFVLVLFVAIVLHQLRSDTPEARWLTTGWRTRAVPVVLSSLIAGHAVAAYRSATSLHFAQFQDMLQTKEYMDHLIGGLEPLLEEQGGPLKFADGALPVYITGFDFEFRRHSHLFDLLDVSVQFTPDQEADFKVIESGEVVSTKH